MGLPKITVDAVITSIVDDGVNYSVDIFVNYGGVCQGFNIQVSNLAFTTVKDCQTWLLNWVLANKSSFPTPLASSLFLGVSVSSVPVTTAG